MTTDTQHSTTPQEAPALPRHAYPESRVAALLGVPVSTLSFWRRGGRLADGVLLGSPPVSVGSKPWGVEYDADRVDAHIAGTGSIFVATAAAE